MTREEAWELLTEYKSVWMNFISACTDGREYDALFARELGFADEEDFWGIVGLYTIWILKISEEHCIKSQEIMKERES